MTAPRWTVRGEVEFRPDGGIAQIAEECRKLLASYLETVGGGDELDPRWTRAPDLPVAHALPARSTISLLLRGREAAGLWVRFGANYVVQGEVDKHTEPAIVEAALAAFRDQEAAGFSLTGSGRRGESRVLLVMEWPSALLVRAQDSTHAELFSREARLPPGGSAVAVVLGELETGLVVDRARVVPLSANRFTQALQAAWETAEELPADQVRSIEVVTDGDPSDNSDEPPTVEAETQTDPGSALPSAVAVPTVEAETPADDEGEESWAVGGMSDGFGLPEPSGTFAAPAIGATSTAPEMAARIESEPDAIQVLPWGAWLDAVANARTDAPPSFEDDQVYALLDLDEGDVDPPGRAIGGWLTPDGTRVPWSTPHTLGDRSRVSTDVTRVLSGFSGSAALVFFGLAVSTLIGWLVAPKDQTVGAPPEKEAIPTISFCSVSNPMFAQAVRDWTGRLASAPLDERGRLSSSALTNASGTDPGQESPTALRSEFCALAHRVEPDGRGIARRGLVADRVLAEACFQVLGRPEQYQDSQIYQAAQTGRRRGARRDEQSIRANVDAFLTDERLRVQELVELRAELEDSCNTCETMARRRIRRRATLGWLNPDLWGGMPVAAVEQASLNVCTEQHAIWGSATASDSVRPGEREAVLIGEAVAAPRAPRTGFDYERYERVRYPRGSRATRPDEWACFNSAVRTGPRPILRVADELLKAARVVAPRRLAWTPDGHELAGLGLAGVASQLGFHLTLSDELTSSQAGSAGPEACSRLAQNELASTPPVFPLYGGAEEEEPPLPVRDLCGQVCAGYFRALPPPRGWKTQEEDLKLCVTGRVTRDAPERLCQNRTLPIPRTDLDRPPFEQGEEAFQRRFEFDPEREDTWKLLDARWSPGQVGTWFAGVGSGSPPDQGDRRIGLDCGITEAEEVDPALEPEPGLDVPAIVRPALLVRDLMADEADATIGALPDPVLACGAQLIRQEDLTTWGLPPLLPAGSQPDEFLAQVEAVAEELADDGLAVQRTRRACEELGALCFTSAALLVNRPDVLWSYADQLATESTAEDFALAMGSTLERTYSRDCKAKPGSHKRVGRCPAEWHEDSPDTVCSAVCQSGATNYQLPARNAVASARLDAAFALAAATPICSGLRDLWDQRQDGDLSFESACLDGVEAQRALAMRLLEVDR